VGPDCQLHPLPHAGRPLLLLLITSGDPTPPSSILGCRPSCYSHRHHSLPLIPLLTSPPSSMALKPLTPSLLSPATPLRCSPGPYKRAMRPPALTAPHPLSPELLRALLRRRDELKPPPFAASGALPRSHSSITGEHLPSTTSTGSSSPSITGEHQRAPASARRMLARHRRALCPRSTAPWTRSTEFFVEN
jgi:hypothetical protein